MFNKTCCPIGSTMRRRDLHDCPWSQRLQTVAEERLRFRLARQSPDATHPDVAGPCAQACAAIAAEKASLDQLTTAARRRHALLRRAESCRRYVDVLASSMHEASDGSVSAARVPLDQPECRSYLEAAGANAAELRVLTAYRLHNQPLLDAWEARRGTVGSRGPGGAANTLTLATLLPLECLAHALVFGLPPYLVDAPPAWLEHGVGSGAWMDPASELSVAAAAAPAPAPALTDAAAPSPAPAAAAAARPEPAIGALLRRSSAVRAPTFFGGTHRGARGFHQVLAAQLRVQQAAEQAEAAALAAEEAEPPASPAASPYSPRAADAATSLESLADETEDDGWGGGAEDGDDSEGAEPSRWLLLCRVLLGGSSLADTGRSEEMAATAVLPVFAVQLDGDGHGGGGAADTARVDSPGVACGAAAAAEVESARRGGRSGASAPAPAPAPLPGAAPAALLETAAWREWQEAHARAAACATAARARVAAVLDEVRRAHAPARAAALAEAAQGELELQRLLADARKARRTPTGSRTRAWRPGSQDSRARCTRWSRSSRGSRRAPTPWRRRCTPRCSTRRVESESAGRTPPQYGAEICTVRFCVACVTRVDLYN